MTGHTEQTTAAGGWPADQDVPASARWSAVARVLEVAAAGGHHLALLCPPGATNTVLVPWLSAILPDLDEQEVWEVAALHALAGRPRPGRTAPLSRPVQTPHHRIGTRELIGSALAWPGVLSLAHRGVLVLEQAPRFSPRVWQALCQPLDEGKITLCRAGLAVELPARVQLVATATPCSHATATGDTACEPEPPRHRCRRVARPLLGRIDIHTRLNPPATGAWLDHSASEPTLMVADRVAAARMAAMDRWAELGRGLRSNAEVPGTVLRSRRWRPSSAVLEPIQRLLDAGELSARRYDRLLRIAWTIADLAGHGGPDEDDVNEAIRLGSGTVTWCTAAAEAMP